MSMRCALRVGFGLVALFVANVCLGATSDDARVLRNDALKQLQAGSSAETDPNVYAEAVTKLQQAQQILESLNQSETPLAQDVNAALFWARKFTVIQMAPRDSAPKKATTPVPPVVAQNPGSKPAEKAAAPAASTPGTLTTAAARAKFEAVAAFAKENPADDFVLALRWFQVADEVAGTEYSGKALTLAREAQERNLARQEPVAQAKREELPDTPGNRLLKQADELVHGGKYTEAFPIYTRALMLTPSALARRKFGLAYFKYAQLLKDRLAPEIEAAEDALARARQEGRDRGGPPSELGGGRWGRRRTPSDSPAMRDAKRKLAAVKERSTEADGYYDKAWEQFKKALDSSPGRRNLDAAAHAGLCLSLKFDMLVKDAAILALDSVLTKYKPVNDVERTLYEFCRSERARLTK